MDSRIRAGGLAACVVLSLVLASATSGAPTQEGGEVGAPGGSVIGIGATAQPSPTPPPGALPAGAGIAELRAAAKAPLVELDVSGNVASVVAAPGTTIPNPDGRGADGFVQRYAGAFGLTRAYSAVRERSMRLPEGDTVTRYRQVANGLPVIGGDIVVTSDARGGIRGAAAEATAAAPTATTAAVSEADAGTAALTAAASRFSLEASRLRVGAASLWIYDPRLIGAPGRPGARPTWWVEVVGSNGDKAATVLVDATDATVALALTAKREAQPNRIVCDLNGAEDVREFDLSDVNVYGCNEFSALGKQSTTRQEGGAASSVADVNRAYTHLGATHGFYQTNFGRDSYDGRGGQLRATVRACQQDIFIPPYVYDFYCPYPNAFWDGYQLVFGAGYATDDVTAHEYTHAVIDHASQLFYAYQSGAINESFADILGELVDRSFTGSGEDTSKLWLIGEDLPLPPAGQPQIRELRDMADPGRLGQPSTFFGSNYYNGDDDNGGVHQNNGVGNHVAYLVAVGGNGIFGPFPGIGLTKSAMLWYRAMHLMPSGGDYPMLGRVLERSCVELVGHHGFTTDDCFLTVRSARVLTGVNYAAPDLGCGGGSTPDPAVFADDFERSTAWTLTQGWWMLPSPEVPVSYAASSKGSLYGFTPSNGPTGLATMKGTFTVPTNLTYGGPHLNYRLLGPALGFFETSTGPMWQYNDVNDAAGWQDLGYHVGRGGVWEEDRIGLSALAGKKIRLRVRIAPGQTDWLIDDVHVNSCTYTYFGRPYDISSVWSGTTADVSWKYSSMPQDHFELSYSPPIPGAPTFLPGLGINQSEVPRSVTLTGLDPAVTYRMTITLVDDQNHDPSRPVTFEIRAEPTTVCPTRPPLPFQIWTPRRPPPGDGTECGFGEVVTRRPVPRPG